jgi:hypothetical protein
MLSAPRLRTILVEHSIFFSTSASKEQLITAITEKLLPRYKPLLEKQTATASHSTSNQAQAFPARAIKNSKQTTTTSAQPSSTTFRTKHPSSPASIPPLLPTSRDHESEDIKDITGSGPYIKAHNDYVAKIVKLNATSPPIHHSPPGLRHPVSIRPAQERLQETQEVMELIDQMVHFLTEDQKQYAKRAKKLWMKYWQRNLRW